MSAVLTNNLPTYRKTTSGAITINDFFAFRKVTSPEKWIKYVDVVRFSNFFIFYFYFFIIIIDYLLKRLYLIISYFYSSQYLCPSTGHIHTSP